MLVVNGDRKVAGGGIVNSLIDSIPLPPVWGNFCGPGGDTAKDVAENIQPTDQVDNLCRNHDLVYWKHHDLETRHKADQELIDGLWKIFKAGDTPSHLRVVAWWLMTIMKGKVKFGMGCGDKTKQPAKPRGKTASGGVPKKRSTEKKTKQGRGINGKKMPGVRVIPLPKRGGILQYLFPLLTGLSNYGSFAQTATDSLKALQQINDKGLDKRAILAPFKKGWGLYLKPYNPNC